MVLTKRFLSVILVGALLMGSLWMMVPPANAGVSVYVDPEATADRGSAIWTVITASVVNVEPYKTPGINVKVKFTFTKVPTYWAATTDATGPYVQVQNLPSLVWKNTYLLPVGPGSFGWYPESTVKLGPGIVAPPTWQSKVQARVNMSAVAGKYEYKIELFEMTSSGTTTTPSGGALAEPLATDTGTLTINAPLPTLDWWGIALLVMALLGLGGLMIRRTRLNRAV